CVLQGKKIQSVRQPISKTQILSWHSNDWNERWERR
ncbi:uncharacterized protein METZ01_LOCUS287496, partial [marine metagenome]